MTFQLNLPDNRCHTRERRSDAMFWRSGHAESLQMGWLLEESPSGLAFAWRGEHAPSVDSILELHMDHSSIKDPPRLVRVRRVRQVHDDLVVIAAEDYREFPVSAVLSAAETEGFKPKASRYVESRAA